MFRTSCAYPREPLGQPCSEPPPGRSRALCACKQATDYRAHLQSHFPGTGWPCPGLLCVDHHRQRSLARCAARERNLISEMMVLPRLEPSDLSSPKVLFSWYPDGRGKLVRQGDRHEPMAQLQGQSFPAKGLPRGCLQLSTSLGSTQLFCDGGSGRLPHSV